MRGRDSRNPSNKRMSVMAAESSEMESKNEEKKGNTGDQIHEFQVCLRKLGAAKDEDSKDKIINHILATQKDKGNTLKDKCITDNGTSDHMTSDQKMFYKHKLLSGKDQVSIVDGSNISIVDKRSIDVLHVFDLPLNLLPISKITKELNCELTFIINHCVKHNLETERRIRISLASKAVYTLPVKVAIALVSTMSL